MITVTRPPAAGTTPGRIRVGVFTPSLLLGGAELWISNLLKYCDSRRIAWQGVAIENPANINPLVAAEVENNCRIISGPRAARLLSINCDVLLVWGIGNFHEFLSNRPWTHKTIGVIHGMGDSTRDVINLWADQVDHIVSVCSAAVSTVPGAYRHVVKVIYNGIDPLRVRPKVPASELRRQWGVLPESCVLGYLGRLSYEKNPQALAYGIDLLPERYVGVLVGDGVRYKEISAIVQAVAGDRVRVVGPTQDVGSALAAFDYALLPSYEEACSLALIEYWLARRPVIATPVGMAGEHPDLIRMLPCGASGPEVRQAVLDDEGDPDGRAKRVVSAYDLARRELTTDRFGTNWTDYLVQIARSL